MNEKKIEGNWDKHNSNVFVIFNRDTNSVLVHDPKKGFCFDNMPSTADIFQNIPLVSDKHYETYFHEQIQKNDRTSYQIKRKTRVTIQYFPTFESAKNMIQELYEKGIVPVDNVLNITTYNIQINLEVVEFSN